jgi:hypothetical protein
LLNIYFVKFPFYYYYKFKAMKVMKSQNIMLIALLGTSSAIKVQHKNSKPRIPYDHGKVSDYIADGDRFDDLKPEKASNFDDPVVEDIGFRSKTPWGHTGYAQK